MQQTAVEMMQPNEYSTIQTALTDNNKHEHHR